MCDTSTFEKTVPLRHQGYGGDPVVGQENPKLMARTLEDIVKAIRMILYKFIGDQIRDG